MRDMKKWLMVSCVLISMLAAGESQPPESFCGFTFGEVYTDELHVALAKPFRYCTQALIGTTKNEHRIFRVSIYGATPESMSEEDAQTELQRVREIVEKRYGIKMTQRRGHLEYRESAFSIVANVWDRRGGIRKFDVVVARDDIEEADKNAAIKGAQPLPPDDGIENL